MQDVPVAPSLAAWQGSQRLAAGGGAGQSGVPLGVGDYVAVAVEGYKGGTLLARPLARTSIAEFVGVFGGTLAEAAAAVAAGDAAAAAMGG